MKFNMATKVFLIIFLITSLGYYLFYSFDFQLEKGGHSLKKASTEKQGSDLEVPNTKRLASSSLHAKEEDTTRKVKVPVIYGADDVQGTIDLEQAGLIPPRDDPEWMSILEETITNNQDPEVKAAAVNAISSQNYADI